MSWCVGKGKTIHFWEDRWLDFDCSLGELAVAPLTDGERKCKVDDYVLPDGKLDRSKFEVFLPPSVRPHIAALLCSYVGRNDGLLWKSTSSGQFSAATAYESSCRSKWNQRDTKWAVVVWSWKRPEKIKTFLRLVLHDSLMTNLQRLRRGMTTVGECWRCQGELETTEHVLRGGCRAAAIWLKILHADKVCSFMDLS